MPARQPPHNGHRRRGPVHRSASADRVLRVQGSTEKAARLPIADYSDAHRDNDAADVPRADPSRSVETNCALRLSFAVVGIRHASPLDAVHCPCDAPPNRINMSDSTDKTLFNPGQEDVGTRRLTSMARGEGFNPVWSRARSCPRSYWGLLQRGPAVGVSVLSA